LALAGSNVLALRDPAAFEALAAVIDLWTSE
jgi:hypothetical protein